MIAFQFVINYFGSVLSFSGYFLSICNVLGTVRRGTMIRGGKGFTMEFPLQ